MRNRKLFIILIIFLIAFVVRFYKLGSVPAGLSQDETSIGYNAYSILKTGADEYGKSFPVNFKAFGEYKLPVYIYLSVPSVGYFGTTPIGVRFPSAVLGFLTVIVFYFMVKNLTKNDSILVLSTFLLAINPWHVNFSRAAFEVVPALFFIVTGVYIFIKFIDRKNLLFLITSGIFFILSMYTYNICRIFAPILFFTLLYFYRSEINFKKTGIWISLSSLIFFLLPFLISIVSQGGFESTKGTLLYTSAPVQASLLEMRSMVLTHNSLLATIFFNKYILTIFAYFKNIVDYFSVSFFFVSGSIHGNHGIGNVGMFYLFEFVSIAIGIFTGLKNKQKWITLLFLWIIGEILVASLTREVPHGTRGFFLIPPLIILSGYGLYVLGEYIKKLDSKFRMVVSLLFVLLISFNLLFYFSSYYFRFPLLYGSSWRSQDEDLVGYIKKHETNYSRIIFDSDSSFIYTSLLYYLPYKPQLFVENVRRGPDDSEGFSKVHSFGKYSIEKIDWGSQMHKTLIISTLQNVAGRANIVKTFYYPKRPVVIANGQEILQFPTEDVAYVLVEIK